jgi:hypothetical protein
VACGRVNSHLLRSDGAVDRVTWRCGGGVTVASTINPPAVSPHIHPSLDMSALERAHFFYSSRCSVNVTPTCSFSCHCNPLLMCGGVVTVMSSSHLILNRAHVLQSLSYSLLCCCGPSLTGLSLICCLTCLRACCIQGQRYISVAAGRSTSYLLREDGAIDTTKGWGTVSSTRCPPPGEWCAPVVIDTPDAGLVRNDVLFEHRVSRDVRKGIETSDRRLQDGLPISRNDNKQSARAHCLVRADGGVDYVRCRGWATTSIPPPETAKYIASSSISCACEFVPQHT